MARPKRPTPSSLSDAGSLRVRAAWLYFSRGLTQQQVADQLGISRSTVIRLLEEARLRAEVQIWINSTSVKNDNSRFTSIDLISPEIRMLMQFVQH